MRQKLLCALLSIVTFAVVWLVATPAHARTGAPVCDPRGAVVFAPPPQQQDPEVTLDIVVNDDDCTQSPLEQKHATPGNAPAPDAGAAAREPASAISTTIVARATAEERLPAPAATAERERPGFRPSFERPPRA